MDRERARAGKGNRFAERKATACLRGNGAALSLEPGPARRGRWGVLEAGRAPAASRQLGVPRGHLFSGHVAHVRVWPGARVRSARGTRGGARQPAGGGGCLFRNPDRSPARPITLAGSLRHGCCLRVVGSWAREPDDSGAPCAHTVKLSKVCVDSLRTMSEDGGSGLWSLDWSVLGESCTL